MFRDRVVEFTALALIVVGQGAQPIGSSPESVIL
jgi:hypothetical protein